MAEPTIPKDIAKMSFEEALAELEGIVRGLEDGQGKLDDAINSYQRGAALKTHCEARLREARAKVEKINVGPDGAAAAEPTDLD